MQTDIHVLSGISNHDPRIRTSEDSSCLKPRGHSDRLEGVQTEKLGLQRDTFLCDSGTGVLVACYEQFYYSL
jgi:hypothetical protein